eukprot:scaffold188225_cov43-Cyclotella_meneghiniana.AAC.2
MQSEWPILLSFRQYQGYGPFQDVKIDDVSNFANSWADATTIDGDEDYGVRDHLLTNTEFTERALLS